MTNIRESYSQETDEDRIMTFRPRYFHTRQNRISYDNELCNDVYPLSLHIVLLYPVSTLLFLLEKMKSIQIAEYV